MVRVVDCSCIALSSEVVVCTLIEETGFRLLGFTTLVIKIDNGLSMKEVESTSDENRLERSMVKLLLDTSDVIDLVLIVIVH
jgi:hypothetical protein